MIPYHTARKRPGLGLGLGLEDNLSSELAFPMFVVDFEVICYRIARIKECWSQFFLIKG
jgi:hypothetical protein